MPMAAAAPVMAAPPRPNAALGFVPTTLYRRQQAPAKPVVKRPVVAAAAPVGAPKASVTAALDEFMAELGDMA